SLLPGEAQAAMGQVHAEAELPFQILSAEGFEPDEYIDIFDGGPILQAHRNALRTFAQATPRKVCANDDGGAARSTCLIAAAREEHFRAVIADCAALEMSDGVMLTSDTMRRLDVLSGDTVLYVKL
ncbi:MAG: arginine N-succinyltransferase, partial [Noviherbaspirillum sp.]